MGCNALGDLLPERGFSQFERRRGRREMLGEFVVGMDIKLC